MTTYNPLQLFTLPPRPADPKPFPTALALDSFSDTLWIGSSSGHVGAFCYPLALTQNVHFPAHGSRADALGGLIGHPDPAVRQMRVTDREVWTLTDGGVAGRKRGGLTRWSISDPMRSLRTMAPSPTNSHELLAAGTAQMLLINNARGEVVRRYDCPTPIIHLAPLPRTIVAASMSGAVSILDPRTNFRSAPSLTVQAHLGGLSGADAQGNLVCTWGWTHMQGHPVPDPMVQIYDVRTLRPLPPISFASGPSFALLDPSNPSRLLVASQSGVLQLADMAAGTSEFQQLDVASYVTSMALSARGDYLVFGDTDGQVHVWTTHQTDGSKELPPFNGYEGSEPEWPTPEEPLPQINWNDATPLNLIGLPEYEDPLLSNFAPKDYATVTSPFFNPPEPIPPAVLAAMKVTDFIGYATTPREIRGKRNVVTARPGAGRVALGRGAVGVRRESEPRFRSDKNRNSLPVEEETVVGEIPKYYRKVEIKYSRFGVEDFDFEYYNRTEFSGLETDILNSYTNALLQALHYIRPIRAVAKAHICVDCQKEHCLLCEAGFLFRMLEDARGVNCQASNFSRAFSATPQATALGLMDDDKVAVPCGTLIQNLNRWLLSIFSLEAVVNGETFAIRKSTMDGSNLNGPVSAINQIVGINVSTVNTCQSCGHVSAREAVQQAVDLAYPRRAADVGSFAELVGASLVRDASTKATCPACKQFAYLESKRTLAGALDAALPPVLAVNAGAASAEMAEVWKDRYEGGKLKRFLPRRVGFKMDNGELVASDDGDIVYEVQSLVVQVQTSPENPPHLLAFVRMPDDDWVLFNDFLVRHVKEDEVFRFADAWKVPAVIFLERVDAPRVLQLDTLPTHLDPAVLFKDLNLAWHRKPAAIKHRVLTPDEMPSPGTMVAIDAEFVALQQEEMEFRSDGTKNILRPSHMSLARVSVLRGEGEAVPFIDDYIRTTETIVDYLTEFSGIKAGDLDEKTSTHTLVPLKVAYKKLRLLVDLGCTFLGHGLSKDFRIINIYVPPRQVADTVALYTLPNRSRKLSLRFLTWFLLKREIQSNEHDSIEDAHHALLLYRLYREFVDDGRFEDVMEDIFFEGQRVGFKPPTDRPTTPSTGAGAFPPLTPLAQALAPLASPQPQPHHSRRAHKRGNGQWGGGAPRGRW
ncbi:poly(A)-specific ribonuclease [Cryptotrichosporon argae]